jgi:glycosyltransferase involved in cell wall biosynthesis
MLNVANTLMGTNLKDDTLIVSIGGRYEFKNKGIDMFVDAMNRLRNDSRLDKDILAFILVPAWVKEARPDLQRKLAAKEKDNLPCGDPRITHNLNNQEQDHVLGQMNWLGLQNRLEDKVKVIFVPCYLDGKDGIFNIGYYDLLVGMDLCIYPSYYEPWGYTPLESVAFHVPCITTDLAGFGLWANKVKGGQSVLLDGVHTVHRSDYNFEQAASEICDAVVNFTQIDNTAVEQTRKNAAALAEKALWKHFITYYQQAYDIALRKAKGRK